MSRGRTANAHNEQDDNALVADLAAGKKDSLRQLYGRHAPVLLATAIKMLGNRADGEDLVHDVFMEAWRKADTFDPERGSVRAWLFIRLRSRAKDRLRAPRRTRRQSLDSTSEQKLDARAEPLPPPPLASQSRALYDAVMDLSEDLRATVAAVYLEGQSVKAAASRLSVPVGTIKSRLSTARARMRSALEARGIS